MMAIRMIIFVTMLLMGFTQCVSNAFGETPDYTLNVRAEYAKKPVRWCAEMRDLGREEGFKTTRAYCEDALTDSCIVYLEKCTMGGAK